MTGIYRVDSPKLSHIGNIWGVYVRPGWRKAGVASALINACVDWAQGHNLSKVKLAVVTTNGDAVHCYLRCGFQVYCVEPDAIRYDGKSYDELLMARRLG